MDPATASKLHCRYVTNGNPYLILQPAKEEEAFLSPRIVVYHDVLFDEEIKTIQELARPRVGSFKFRINHVLICSYFQLGRATVVNPTTGKLEFADYRTSKSSWLDSGEHRHIAQVVRRVGDITGLDMEDSEPLQVVNYGIGGHYEPHLDAGVLQSQISNLFV